MGVAGESRGGSSETRPGPRICGRSPPRAGQPALDGWSPSTVSRHLPQSSAVGGRAASSGGRFSWGDRTAWRPVWGLRRSVPPDYVMGERERRAIRCRHPLCGVRAEREAARASTHPGRRLPVRHRPVRRLRRRPPRRVPQRVASAVDDGSVVRFTRRRTPTDPTRPAGRFPGPGRRARHDLARPGGSRHRSGAPSCARRSGSVAASSSSTTASGSSNTWRCPHLGMVTQRVCSGS